MRNRIADRSKRGFTLIELLVVIAIISVLAAILYPIIVRATLRAKVTRVHSDLKQIAIAIDMYNEDCGGLPPVRSCCSGSAKWDYYEIPQELSRMHYLAIPRMYDPFNRTCGGDDRLGRTYKYVAINWGYSGITFNPKAPPWFSMWIPRDYPVCRKDCILYYKYAGQIYAYDNGKTYPKTPPIMWAVWSVGPGGDQGLVDTGNRMLPLPRDQWYPVNENGVIARFSDGRKSP
ncbi:MAG: prepilin-type N-terminal cleavage/methylation domain-containing protein [Armatimonadota bacterium]